MKKEKKLTAKEDEEQLRKNPINVFQCGKCEKSDSMTGEEFKKHLKDVHGIEKMQGRKQMIMHMDGSYWFSSTYEWILDSGLKFHQFVKLARSKNSYMNY